MPSCAVYGCKNYSKKTKGTNISYFSFPKDEEFKAKWIIACRRKDRFNTKTARICSEHFPKEMFGKPLCQELLGYSPPTSRKIKMDAVPTEKLPVRINSDADQNSVQNRRDRYNKRLRKDIVKELLASSEKASEHSDKNSQQTKLGCSPSLSNTTTVNTISAKRPLLPKLKTIKSATTQVEDAKRTRLLLIPVEQVLVSHNNVHPPLHLTANGSPQSAKSEPPKIIKVSNTAGEENKIKFLVQEELTSIQKTSKTIDKTALQTKSLGCSPLQSTTTINAIPAQRSPVNLATDQDENTERIQLQHLRVEPSLTSHDNAYPPAHSARGGSQSAKVEPPKIIHVSSSMAVEEIKLKLSHLEEENRNIKGVIEKILVYDKIAQKHKHAILQELESIKSMFSVGNGRKVSGCSTTHFTRDQNYSTIGKQNNVT